MIGAVVGHLVDRDELGVGGAAGDTGRLLPLRVY